jgi:hypothetical protein
MAFGAAARQWSATMFETIIAGNLESCRTEAEIADESGNRLAIVYEDSEGWHTQVVDARVEQSAATFSVLIENAKELLSHYVNRRGENLPSGVMTAGQSALWLMVKDDGTTMGLRISPQAIELR